MPSAAPADPHPVLVAGASGYLGGHLARELLRRGVPVRALVRATDAQAARELQAAGAECLAVDATQPGALVGVCDGCRAVASCLAADMHWRRRAGADGMWGGFASTRAEHVRRELALLPAPRRLLGSCRLTSPLRLACRLIRPLPLLAALPPHCPAVPAPSPQRHP